uniref:Palmitoyl-protein thioesterase 1 n=1 Tax=Quercus lobata TaxID=97700 RepID=A0A7N2LF57_QUELO
MHFVAGIIDKCSSEVVTTFTENLSNWSGSQGYCVEIGDGVSDSWTMPMLEQVKNISELSEGYNIVGLSQGTLIGRGVVELCDGAPPVKNFISVGGVHAGIASIPFCGSERICALLDQLIESMVYTDWVQDISAYLEGCKFLPKLNNEINATRNSTYKERFASLQNLVLIMFEQDTVLVPKETSWFGYYPDGAFYPVLPAQETLLYTEDWIGLKILDEAGKVKFINVSGGHLEISTSDMKTYIVPYLEDETSRQVVITETSPFNWLSSIWHFFLELIGFSKDQPLLRMVD